MHFEKSILHLKKKKISSQKKKKCKDDASSATFVAPLDTRFEVPGCNRCFEMVALGAWFGVMLGAFPPNALPDACSPTTLGALTARRWLWHHAQTGHPLRAFRGRTRA